jgi:hypothetical protein
MSAADHDPASMSQDKHVSASIVVAPSSPSSSFALSLTRISQFPIKTRSSSSFAVVSLPFHNTDISIISASSILTIPLLIFRDQVSSVIGDFR